MTGGSIHVLDIQARVLRAPITSCVTVSAPPAPKRPPRLVLRFAIYSAIALALAWVAIFWVVRARPRNAGRQQVRSTRRRRGRAAPSLTGEADFAGPVTLRGAHELDAVFERELVGNLLRVKLWSPAGVVTYSTDPELIGERADDPRAAGPAGRPDRAGGHLLNDEGRPPRGRREGLRVLRSRPRRASRPTAGVLEVYEAYAPVAADDPGDGHPVGDRLALALLLLYAALFPILRQVTKALDNRHKGLEQHAPRSPRHSTNATRPRSRQPGRAELPEPGRAAAARHVRHRLDATSSCIYMSPQIEDLVGYTPLECMSDPEFFVRILHPDDRERTLAARRKAYESGESFSIKYRMIAKDGRSVWVHDEVTIAKDAGRAPCTRRASSSTSRRRRPPRRSASASTRSSSAARDRPAPDRRARSAEAARAHRCAGRRARGHPQHVRLPARRTRSFASPSAPGSFADNVGTHRQGRGPRRPSLGDGPTARGRRLHRPGRAASRLRGDDFHAVVGVPLRSRTEVVGVLGLAHDRPGRPSASREIASSPASPTSPPSRSRAPASTPPRRRSCRSAGAPSRAPRGRAPLPDARRAPSARHLHQPGRRVGGEPLREPAGRGLLATRREEWIENPTCCTTPSTRTTSQGVLADAARLRKTGEPLRSEYRYLPPTARRLGARRDDPRPRRAGHATLGAGVPRRHHREQGGGGDARGRAAIVESSSDAITSASLDLRSRAGTRARSACSERRRTRCSDEPITSLMPAGPPTGALELLGEVVAEDRVAPALETALDGERHVFHVAFTYSPIHDSAGAGRRRLRHRPGRHRARARPRPTARGSSPPSRRRAPSPRPRSATSRPRTSACASSTG